MRGGDIELLTKDTLSQWWAERKSNWGIGDETHHRLPNELRKCNTKNMIGE